MESSIAQSIKLVIASVLDLSKDALHIHLGLAVFVAVALVLRKPLRSAVPWLATAAIAFTGELVDMRDEIGSLEHWRWGASLHDVINTLFWPTLLSFLARMRILWGSCNDRQLQFSLRPTARSRKGVTTCSLQSGVTELSGKLYRA